MNVKSLELGTFLYTFKKGAINDLTKRVSWSKSCLGLKLKLCIHECCVQDYGVGIESVSYKVSASKSSFASTDAEYVRVTSQVWSLTNTTNRNKNTTYSDALLAPSDAFFGPLASRKAA